MTEPRWYSVNCHGVATLCSGHGDALRESEQNDVLWPRGAPHRAVELLDVQRIG